MQARLRILPVFIFALALVEIHAFAQNLELKNAHVRARFGVSGLRSVEDVQSGVRIDLAEDAWLLEIGGATIRSGGLTAEVKTTAGGDLAYEYETAGYRIQVTYRLRPEASFVGKQIVVLRSPHDSFTVQRVVPWVLTVTNPVRSDFVPSTYIPQLGADIRESHERLPGKDFGEFLRFDANAGAMLIVQNPFLEVEREGQSVSVGYAPDLDWKQSWGTFQSDTALLSAYRLTGRRLPREMVREWHVPPGQLADDGADQAEVDAYSACVRSFLIAPAPSPISVEVGWTLNDYQIDVGTPEGRTEYKRIIDEASGLGVRTLLYAPENSKLAEREQSADTWKWEYVLWLGLGEKIRKGEWDPDHDQVPGDVSEMLAYARQKHVGLLAYVYPSIPFAKNSAWLVKGSRALFTDPRYSFATLASREFQDYLIHDLIVFAKRTGISGYSFDYTWLNLPGSSSYAQWFGWRRVMETLRKQDPWIVIDGRQSYQLYGPWSWLAGSYPHPTGNDEQPESFKPYPDLHFDRVSADRTRFVNYWYRNYQFAPEEIIPGYATHQTERSRNVGATGDPHPRAEMMLTSYRPRDWDYLGFKYSFISSIATGGWNNVVDMIPARDLEEARHFSLQDKAWIRNWLDWTVKNKEYLRHTRTILGQPALGRVDGTASILGDRGYIFLFNPNYKQLPAEFSLDDSIGLAEGQKFLLKELYPKAGLMLGKPHAGAWQRGDAVNLQLDGTSATVFELIPAGESDKPILFNAASLRSVPGSEVELNGTALSILHVAGEPGTMEEIGVSLPGHLRVSALKVNGHLLKFTQTGNYVEGQVRFGGAPFAQAQEISVVKDADGSLEGTFLVPQRVMDQLAARKLQWPIPWTQEDYQTTWLAPERLLLFVQSAEPQDTMAATASVDGKPLQLTPAYSSVRTDPACFVGFYADLSGMSPDVRHTIELRIPESGREQLQGIFFDNVLPQLTELLAP